MLDGFVEQYLANGIAPSSRRVYEAGIRKYKAFCNQIKQPLIPASELLLCRFIVSLAIKDLSHNSIKVYLAAVRQLHIQRGKPPPHTGDMPRLQQILRGIKISQASTPKAHQERLPMQPDMLRSIKRAWEQGPIDEDKQMLWAAFTMAFFGFMRSGELCARSLTDCDTATTLTPQDVSVDSLANPQLIRIRLRSSKTDPFRKGTDIYLARTHDELCPVSATLAWLSIRGNSTGPLFRFKSGAPLTRQSFVEKLKGALAIAGIKPDGFSGHSFRSGAATAAAKLGIGDSQIKLLGRWKSEAYHRYIKPSGSHLASLASSIAKQGLHTTSQGHRNTQQ